ncbi:MAG: glycosyltransferase family 39 protein [Steroidobacteraceae bacterium]
MPASTPRIASPFAALALALLACALAVSTYPVFGNTWDEPEHIAAGLVLLERDEYRFDDQHPPLARLAAAIGPFLAGARLPRPLPSYGDAAGRSVLYHSAASYDTLLTLARLGMLPFLLLLVLATWHWARRVLGGAGATLAAAFLVTTPVILGHAGLAAIDVPVTALIILALGLVVRWLETPTRALAAGFGLAAGLATATKLSAVPFIGVALLALGAARAWCVGTPPRQWRWRERLVGLALAALLAALVPVAIYGPRLTDIELPLLGHLRLPLGVAEVADNFVGVAFHNAHGHPSFLLGETRLYGWWYFYFVALAVKTPLPLLLAGLAGLALLARRGLRERSVPLLSVPLAFVAILGFSAVYSHINIGVRHVMVLYPLLAIGAAQAVQAAWRASAAMADATRRGALRVLLAGLLAWQAATLLAWPDYLAWFNVLAGEHPERILVDSDLDWGQDLRRLSRELARRHVDALYLAYSGSADLTLEHLPPFQALPRDRPVSGWVAIDMLTLKDGRPHYDWLLAYTPVARVGKSIDLYRIDAPRAAATVSASRRPATRGARSPAAGSPRA